MKKHVVWGIALALAAHTHAFAAVDNVIITGTIDTVAVDRTNFGFGLGNDDIGVIATTSLANINFDISENVEALITVGEDRVWGLVNQAYTQGSISLKKLFDLPVSLTIGTQPVVLGSGLLVGNPGTNQGFTASTDPYARAKIADLNKRSSFDSAVAVIDLAPTTIQLGYLKVSEGDALTTASLMDDDKNAYFVYGTHNLSDTTFIDAYYVLKDTQKQRALREDTQNIGARIMSTPAQGLTWWAEACYQWSKGYLGTTQVRADTRRHSDYALTSGIVYTFIHKKWLPTISADFAYLSDNWDPMFESLTPARIANALFPNTNCLLFGATASISPREDLSIKMRYINLQLNAKIPALGNMYSAGYAVNSNKTGLGNEVDISIAYDYTEDVQFGVYQDFFMPGNFFTDASDQTARQTLATLKVSF